MHPDWIATFLDLCETRSFNRTAERLGVTQSTVSGRIGSLEKALEARLFTRSRSGTQLTTAGLRFEPHARALRLSWAGALQAARSEGAAMTLNIGIQHDLTGNHVGDTVRALKQAIPGAAIYLEPDFSTQMCLDVMSGQHDLALVFTPKPHPDLHFESIGEIIYRMVSTHAERLAGVDPERYILTNYSPAFARSHAELLPGLGSAQVSAGHGQVVAELLEALGGSAYVPAETAAAMAAEGRARAVADAPDIPQTVYAAIHLRNRHRPAYRRIMRLLQAQVASA